MMMNCFKLIEPYLFGSLSPEEQQMFERQLVRNPVLANEIAVRFSLSRMLLAGAGCFSPAFFQARAKYPFPIDTGMYS